MEDIYAEIDAQEVVISGESVYTLSDADYTALKLNFGNFSNLNDAKTMLPAFLSRKYPAWGKESLAAVTFKLFNKKNDQKSLITYKANDQDYTDAGLRFPNISNYEQMLQLLNSLYPTPDNRVLVSLTYTERDSGINSEVEDGFIYSNGTWEKSSGITLDEYKAMGESRAQFSSEDEALVKIPVYLKNKLAYEAPKAGDIEGVMYKLYDSNDRVVKSYVVFFIYDGANWAKYNNVINQTIKFGHDGISWVPDNTVKYTLTNADYTLVGNGQYNNFDVRTGKAEEPETKRLEKINTILLNNFPSSTDGQKYIVSYNIYNGANDVWSLAVIKEGNAYVKQ
ncbi:hypothetical protein BTO16_14145 [Polaribacter glomeratus]|uniref:Uncharacterized protein n=2 Tax=Polaribacter glomeratus TaxID=102 RepID=A0A2S7WHA8_9FLAO|nr:hypothetical protein BTO16_14145 [Polaribacter glomeratus]